MYYYFGAWCIKGGGVNIKFAEHARSICQTILTTGEAHNRVIVSILFQENPISCNKSFEKLKSSLCMKEHRKILSYSRDNLKLIIKSNSEFYGACRHTPKFHRNAKTTLLLVLMTDNSSERVDLPPNTLPILNISTNICTYVEQEQPVN